MILIKTLEVDGFLPAMHGMRNPKNSWKRGDTVPDLEAEAGVMVGENDLDLASRLAKGGPVHAKYRRMIAVYADITAPFYWWKEYDTYRFGVEKDSCSTMHTIHMQEFTKKDFSVEHLISRECSEADNFSSFVPMEVVDITVKVLNECRRGYMFSQEQGDTARMKMFWWQMVQLLPSSYNQKRTVMMSYEALANICKWRKGHKLDEWHRFIEWAEGLPYSELFLEGDVK